MAFKFESIEFKRAFEKVLELSKMRNLPNISIPEHIKEVARVLESIERVFPLDGDLSKLDEIISYSSKQEGFDFVARTREVIAEYNSSIPHEKYNDVILLASALIYIYLREYEFQVVGFHPTIGIEIVKFINVVGSELKNNSKYSRYIDFGDRDIVFNILKELFFSNEIKNIKDLESKKIETQDGLDNLNTQIQNWENSLQTRIDEVRKIETSLKSYKDAFNFVGIFDGFNKLHNQKVKELRNARIGLGLIALIIIGVIGYELQHANNLLMIPNQIFDLTKIFMLTIPFTVFVFVLLYFFRIILQTMRSVQSQLLQLDLRMTLCRFIQSYADSASDLKEKHSEGFEKFETLIFSPLVSSDDKIPTTFDGMEQLAKFIDVLGNKK